MSNKNSTKKHGPVKYIGVEPETKTTQKRYIEIISERLNKSGIPVKNTNQTNVNTNTLDDELIK